MITYGRERLSVLVIAAVLLAAGAIDCYWGWLGQYAWVALFILVPLIGGLILRNGSAFAIPIEAMAATALVGEVRLRIGPAFPDVPASRQQSLLWLTTLVLGVITAFFGLAGVALPVAWKEAKEAAARGKTLVVGGLFVAALLALAPGVMWGIGPVAWWPRDLAAALLIFAAMIAATAVLRRWALVPPLTLVAWLTIYGLATLYGIFGPPQPPGETLMSTFLESAFWVIVPLMIGGALGTGMGRLMPANPDHANGGPANRPAAKGSPL